MKIDARTLATLGALTLTATFASGARCQPKRSTVAPLCAFDSLSEEEQQTQALAPITWLTLASPTVDRQTMSRRGTLASACGQEHPPIFGDQFNCPGFEISSERVASDVIEETDLVRSGAGDNRTLLWAATDELVSGEAEGAAALALWTEGGLEVHAVGLLRSYRTGARLLLHNIGKTPVIVVFSDRCDAQNECVQMAQVVPVVNRRLAELPLWEADVGCVGRAQFELDKREERDLGNGWTRRFVLTRSVELEEGGVVVNDLLRMEDFRADNPDAPPTPYRKISAKRPLILEPDRLVLEDEDLWDRALRDHGQVDPDEDGEVKQEPVDGAPEDGA